MSAEWEFIQASSRAARNRRIAAGLALAIGLSVGTLALDKHLENLQYQHVNAARGLAQLSGEAARQSYPQRALLLASEALRSSEEARPFRAPEAEEALRSALAGCGGTPLLLPPGDHVLGAVLGWKHRWLASRTAEGRLRLTSLGAPADLMESPDLTAAEAREIGLAPNGESRRSREVSFSRDGSWIAVRDATESVHLLQLSPAGQEPFPLAQQECRRFQLSPDGFWLATSDPFGSIRLWELRAGAAREKTDLAGGERSPDDDDVLEALAFDAGRLIAVWDDGIARQWDLRDSGRQPTTPDPSAIDAARRSSSRKERRRPSPEGRWQYEIFNDRFELTPVPEGAGRRPLTLRGHDTTADSRSQGVAFGPEGPEDEWAITWSGGEARLWKLSAPLPGAGPRIVPPEELVPENGSVPRWRVEAREGQVPGVARMGEDELEECTGDGPVHDGEVRVVVFSSDGHSLFTAGSLDGGRLWRIGDDGKCSFVGTGPRTAHAAVFGSRHQWLVTGSARGRVDLWDLRREDPGGSAQPLIPSVGEGSVTSLALSADDRWLFAGTERGEARLWQLSDAYSAALPRLETIRKAAFTGDGHLDTTSDDGVRRWTLLRDEASAEKLLEIACRAAGRNFTCEEWRDAFGPDEPYRKTCDLPGPEDPCTGVSSDQTPG